MTHLGRLVIVVPWCLRHRLIQAKNMEVNTTYRKRADHQDQDGTLVVMQAVGNMTATMTKDRVMMDQGLVVTIVQSVVVIRNNAAITTMMAIAVAITHVGATEETEEVVTEMTGAGAPTVEKAVITRTVEKAIAAKTTMMIIINLVECRENLKLMRWSPRQVVMMVVSGAAVATDADHLEDMIGIVIVTMSTDTPTTKCNILS